MKPLVSYSEDCYLNHMYTTENLINEKLSELSYKIIPSYFNMWFLNYIAFILLIENIVNFIV